MHFNRRISSVCSITLDIPEDTSSNHNATVCFRPTETMIIHFKSERVFERNSYGELYYYLIGDYVNHYLSYYGEYTLTLNPGDYICFYAYQQNYGHVMATIKDIVITIDAE